MTELGVFGITVLGQTIIHRVERREKQRGQVRFRDIEKLLIPSREGCRRLHRRRGVCTSRTDLIFSHDGILYQERATWTRSDGTKNRYSWRGRWTVDEQRGFHQRTGVLRIIEMLKQVQTDCKVFRAFLIFIPLSSNL
ncbi:hypothetical protein BG32_10330 [Mesotoga sp. HF07.pep.5.2.highcov]|nr:hypothetical protein BG32_10330 [Mesotoga sp. HF07.pep.5.2.highcov]